MTELSKDRLNGFLEGYRGMLGRTGQQDKEDKVLEVLDKLTGWVGPSDKCKLAWPDHPTCHDGERRYGREAIAWRPPKQRGPAYGDFRTCSYCGSIHPEDLLRNLCLRATLGGSDWKYGWPHKFYVEGVPNLLAGQAVQVGTESKWENDQRTETPIMATGSPDAFCKWYNHHLSEIEDETTFIVLASAISVHSGIMWFKTIEGLSYVAPYRGFQK